jgi:hypothetical protein
MMKSLRVLALLALGAAAARGDDWPHWGRTPDRLRAPSETIASPSQIGAVATGSATVGSPVACDGFLVTAAVDGTIRAFAEIDRAPLWTTPVGATVTATPLVERGRVYVPCADGALRILKLADGSSLGSVTTGGADQSSPVMSGNLLYLASGFPNAALMAIDTATKTVAWTAEFPDALHSSPLIAGGKVIIASSSGTLAAFDPATGAPVWSTTVGGSPGMAAPLATGSSVFVLGGAVLSRVDLDPANWGTNGSVAMVDPSPPPAQALSLERASSSLSLADGQVTGLVRFDYPLDTDGDGFPDSWRMREYAFSVDPASLAVGWMSLLSDTTVGSVNGVPPFKLLPAPVSTGSRLVAASSLDSVLRLLALNNGNEMSSFALDGACLASPFIANARLYAMTRLGTLYAYEGTTAPPAPATGLTPDAIEVTGTPASLSWDSAGAGATYVVRLARDGEILMDWDFETVVSATSTAVPPQLDGFYYTWGVRVQSADLAYAPWSLAVYGQAGPSLPPGSLTATPQLRKVELTWTPSPSPQAAGYRVTYGLTAGGPTTSFDVALVTTTVVGGLTALSSYTFDVQTLDHLGHPSPPVTATAAPLSSIAIAGTPYATIADALAAALPGDIVDVGADVLTIGATLQVPANVTLRGAGALDTRLQASGSILLIEALQGSTIRGLTLAGGQVGAQATGTGVTIRNCILRDMADAGVVVDGSALIINNTIVSNAVAGVRSTGSATARNNILQQNGVGLHGAISSTYNLVNDGYAVTGPGIGDKSEPVVFLDAASGDYREQPNQASLDAGLPWDDYSQEPPLNGGRINMGAFGNTPQAATSLTAGPPQTDRTSVVGCGLLGLEVLILLALRRRRR